MRKFSFSPRLSECHTRIGVMITTLGMLLALTSVVHAQVQSRGLTNLYIFQGSISGPDGGTPTGGLILGRDGNYYGTTWYGGTGGGTVFKVTPTGTESIVYAFSGAQDGQLPSKLVEDADGNFYGTTLWGGGTSGYGIIFKVTPSGEETILQSLTNTGGPANPGAGLTLSADGNFYGTSTAGGANGQGTFFQMTPAGALTVLYSFGGALGGSPAAELIEVNDGEFFGTTRQGGDGGYGTVFKVSATGVLMVLHSFTGGSDGAYPAAPLIYGQDGAFYSTTEAGGTGDCAFPGLPTGCGTVFRVTAAGEESVIHEFAGYPTDGSSPVGGLVQAKDGTFYGTTEAGGFTDPGNCSAGCGTIFSMAPTGTEQILYACGEPPDPWYYDCWAPSGTLLLSAGDTLTGTSQNGGGGWGNVFSIAPAPTATAAPTAVAGLNQREDEGQTVHLDGTGSFAPDTTSTSLAYAWSFVSKPAGSTTSLLGANTATPSFLADAPGTFVVQLIVTDPITGLASAPSQIMISSVYTPPTANAGVAQAGIVARSMALAGSGVDPNGLPLSYAWSFVSTPTGNTATLAGATTANASFTPNVAGSYVVSLIVSDTYGHSPQSTVTISVITADDYAQQQIGNAVNFVATLPDAYWQALGLKNAFANQLQQAIAAIQSGNISLAISKLNDELIRTDGYPVRWALDGPGPDMDWVTNAAAQATLYQDLTNALSVLH